MTYLLSDELSLSNELIVLLSVLYCATFIGLLAFCICGCRKGSPKNDLLGLDGMVKITNPDENVNHLPAVGKYLSQSRDEPDISETDDLNKSRPSGGSNPHRSLPDIPIYAEGNIPGSDNGVSGDTSSDLYATVEDKISNTFNNAGFHNRHSLPNGVHSRIPGPLRQTDNYARVRENPYDKVKKTENPYAKVQTSDENEENSRENSPNTPHTSNAVASGSTAEPVAPPRSRRSSLQNSLIITASNTILPSSTVDIPAATAVAGRIAASQELPYMTPPIAVPQPDGAVNSQQHFSGDSQDSSKGYTSISVREPLELIRKQTKSLRTRKDDIDPHYATVSDDSDDNMYAAIVEPSNQIYNGSETYAQIQPIAVVEVHGHAPNAEQIDETDVPAPELPNVNMKHVTVHSRQASSSSCTSSVANVGSPKPEKRQANSPLPPTPAVSPDMYARVDKNHSRENSRGSISIAKNLEDMYAKVQKHKKKYDDDDKSMHASSSDITNSHYSRSYTPDMNIVPYQKTNHHLDSHSRQSWSSKDSFDENKHIEDMYEYSSDSDIPVDAKSCKRLTEEHCYETLNKNGNKSVSPGKSHDSHEIGYEKIREPNWLPLEPNNMISGPESIISNDPGYEQLHHHSRVCSEIDPNYEVLRPHRTSSLSGSSVGYSTITTNNKSTLTCKSDYETVPNKISDHGYSVVNKRKEHNDPGYEELNNQCNEEPNYESMPSECGNYATVHQKSTESESDPNYESVKYLDVTLSEPPYERLHDDDNKESDASEYEQISSKQSSHITPDYERIKSIGSKSSENSEDRTISDSRFSNGTDEEDNKKEGNGKRLSMYNSVDVSMVDNVEEIIENSEEHMYFQV